MSGWGKKNKRKGRVVPDEGNRQTHGKWGPSPKRGHRERNGFGQKNGDLAVSMLMGNI